MYGGFAQTFMSGGSREAAMLKPPEVDDTPFSRSHHAVIRSLPKKSSSEMSFGTPLYHLTP